MMPDKVVVHLFLIHPMVNGDISRSATIGCIALVVLYKSVAHVSRTICYLCSLSLMGYSYFHLHEVWDYNILLL